MNQTDPKDQTDQMNQIDQKDQTDQIEKAPEGGFWATCPEIPGANGQGETIEQAKENLREAVELILKDRLEDIKRGLPEDAIQETIAIW